MTSRFGALASLRSRTALATLAVGLGTALLLVAAAKNPYHIDELRQVRTYEAPLSWVASKSVEQGQPPLGPLLDAVAQRLWGKGDVRQRMLSVGAGIVVLASIAGLALRAGMSIGAAAAVLAFLLLPVGPITTAYARPYALPLALMLAFVWAASCYVDRRTPATLALLTSTALLLPFARASEPPIFLVAVAAAMAWQARFAREGATRHAARVVTGVVAATLLLVQAPVLLRMQATLAPFSTGTWLPSAAQMGRLATDLPATFARVFFPWWLALALVGLGLASRPSRQRLLQSWAWGVLAFVPLAFTLVFALHARPTQPFYDRYTYFLLPAYALLVGSVVDDAWRARRRWWGTLALGLVALWLTVGAWRVQDALAQPSDTDWRAASEMVSTTLDAETTVLFDDVGPLDAYRTPFAGQPRYLEARWRIPTVAQLVRTPGAIVDDTPVAVLLRQATPEVAGWDKTERRDFSLYVARRPHEGRTGAARACEQFGRALGPERGGAMLLAATALYAAAGASRDVERLVCEAAGQPGQPGRDALIRRARESGLLSGEPRCLTTRAPR